jgi:hypothetical protein
LQGGVQQAHRCGCTFLPSLPFCLPFFHQSTLPFSIIRPSFLPSFLHHLSSFLPFPSFLPFFILSFTTFLPSLFPSPPSFLPPSLP